MRKIPSLRRHKPTSQAVVTLSGRDHYLGVWPAGRKAPPPAIQLAYERLIAEWLASHRLQLPTRPATAGPQNQFPPSSDSHAEEALTVAGLLVAYWEYAESYYRTSDGSPGEPGSPEAEAAEAAMERIVAALVAGLFPRLLRLTIRSFPITVSAARALAAAPVFGGLRELELPAVQLTPDGLAELLAHAQLNRLQFLSLTRNHLGDGGAQVLAAAETNSRRTARQSAGGCRTDSTARPRPAGIGPHPAAARRAWAVATRQSASTCRASAGSLPAGSTTPPHPPGSARLPAPTSVPGSSFPPGNAA